MALSVFVAGLDGTGLRQLRRSADDLAPAWSPDGRWIALVEQRFVDEKDYVWVIEVASGDARQVGPGSQYWWSPRSDRLALRIDKSRGEAQVRIVALRDGRATRIPGAVSFTWAPDGRRFAFGRRGAVYAGAVGRTAWRRIGTGTSPAWSPDGRHIAYAGPPCTPEGGIQIVRPSGDGRRRLTSFCSRSRG